jgi:tripartite-type tricarboxylate transporter receptor subunit TctC
MPNGVRERNVKSKSDWIKLWHAISQSSVLAVALALTPAKASSAAYPERPITIVVPYTPGGTVDILARVLGQELYKSLNQPVVVLNRPGAGGSVGAEYVAHASPDGYTLLLSTSSPLTTNLALYQSLNYDSLRDFAPITLVGENGTVIVANPSLPAKTFNELIVLAKKDPNGILAGTSGNGTGADLSLAQVDKVASAI